MSAWTVVEPRDLPLVGLDHLDEAHLDVRARLDGRMMVVDDRRIAVGLLQRVELHQEVGAPLPQRDTKLSRRAAKIVWPSAFRRRTRSHEARGDRLGKAMQSTAPSLWLVRDHGWASRPELLLSQGPQVQVSLLQMLQVRNSD